MRRTVAAAVMAASVASPAFAGPELPGVNSEYVYVHNDERGVGARVGPAAHPIVAAGVSYEGYACLTIGFWRECYPQG